MMTWVRMQQNQDVEGTSTFRLDKLVTGEELRLVLMTGFCLKTQASFENKTEILFLLPSSSPFS